MGGDSLLGAHDEGGEGEAVVPLVLVQGLLRQQEAVVQHVQRLEEVRVDLHLPQQPGSLLVCPHIRHSCQLATEQSSHKFN